MKKKSKIENNNKFRRAMREKICVTLRMTITMTT